MCNESEMAIRASARAQWMGRYPGYCRACEGHGGDWEAYDPSPAGVSLSPGVMYDWDICPVCSEKGVCPRCGATLPTTHHVDDGVGWNGETYHQEWDETDPDVPCPECGFCYNAEDDDVCPPKWECPCEPDEEYWKEAQDALADVWYP